MKIYTRSGDKGTTSLVGGSRVSKSSVRLEAYGTLDELTAHIGVLHDLLDANHSVRSELLWILSRVMDCSAILASEDTTIAKLPQVTADHSSQLERWMDTHLEGLPELRYFTLPAGGLLLSQSHVCRTVCRRAERRIVAVVEAECQVPEEVAMFVNRLSDYLYALGRRLGFDSGAEDMVWKP